MFLMSTDFGSPDNSLRWLLILLHLIPTGTGIEPEFANVWDFLIRKSAHIVEYFILTWLGYRAARNGSGKSVGVSAMFAFVASVVFACTDEYHQSFHPSRTGQFRDVLVDAFGSVIAVGVILLVSRKRRAVCSPATVQE